MFLLDTNVISELRKAKSGKCDDNVLSWIKNIPTTQLFISVISVLELELGVLQIERKDTAQGALLRTWLDEHVLPAFAEHIVPIDTSIAQRCAKLHVPNPKSDRDAIIAATALVHSMTVVTRNTKDFEPTGVELLNPWKVHSKETETS